MNTCQGMRGFPRSHRPPPSQTVLYMTFGIVSAILFMVLSLALTLMRFIYRHNGIHNLEELRATENVIASRRGEFARQGVVDESKQEFFI
ncbi:glycophorin-C-like [Paramormyrops kingsleyae]|uniref:glycophorin-C-like n=1 Tax=Paramormyrops kingsleyae TaxID=1676925 RepID=UPI000CD5F00F|nr:glycophorin-C-like [Paramormyrops kingsleyae]XP_023665825.1 glycophorin-C-like [Paramormyrops kingsleyae]